jgi:hypothetical protein
MENEMKKYTALTAVLLALILITVVHISCSSDSSSSSGDGSSTPATLDEANVDRTLDYIVQTVPGCSQGTVVTANQAILEAISLTKQQVADKRVRMSPLQNLFQPEAEQTETIDLEGTCGGTMTGELKGDDVTGDISGDISINNFCQGETGSNVVINGKLSFSGNLDPDSGDLTSLSGSSKGITLTVDEAGEQRAYSAAFNASISMSGDTISITVKSFSFADETEGTEIKLQNFTMTVTQGTTQTSVTMSGTINVTDEGSVQFQTVDPLTVSSDGETVGGSIVVQGADNTAMQVTIDNGMLNVIADTDGDGVFETTRCLDCTGVAVDEIL